jgi:hypothetical protein
MAWFRAHWVAILVAVIGLIVGVVVGAFGSKTRTITSTVAKDIQAPHQRARVDRHRTSAGGQSFTGNGTQGIGTISVAHESTLTWRCSSCAAKGMQIISDINDSGNAISILQNGTSGQSVVSAGTYPGVTVYATGPFIIQIKSSR